MPERIVHIVDDDEAVRQSLAFLLGSAGLTVRLYDSASAFLAGLSAVKSGCLVTDVRMPDMTGIELLQQLRAKACHLPAIVITGHGDVPLAVEAMKAGAVDFIEKPFDQEALLHAVHTALERGIEEERAVTTRPSRPSSRPYPSASGRCSKAWSRAIPTRPSPMISALARARSRSIAPI